MFYGHISNLAVNRQFAFKISHIFSSFSSISEQENAWRRQQTTTFIARKAHKTILIQHALKSTILQIGKKQGDTQFFQAPTWPMVCTDICLNYFSLLSVTSWSHNSMIISLVREWPCVILSCFPYYICNTLFYISICIW